MVQSVESRIHKLLLEHGDPLKAADILLKDWDNGNLAWVEQEAVGHFLIKCGFIRAFLDQVAKNLKSGQKIPWSCFAEALGMSRAHLLKEDMDQLFVGAGEEQSLKELVRCTLLDSFDPRFQKIRANMDNTVLRAERTPPPRRIRQVEATVAKTATLQRPVSLGPSVIVEKEFDSEKTSTLVARLEGKEREGDSLKQHVKETFIRALEKSPGQEHEAAIALGMMGAWGEGLEILRSGENTFDRRLLELEFLFQAGKNIQALQLVDELFQENPNLEQKTHIQFLQARTLVSLKRSNEAAKILEELIRDSPNHHVARTLLDQIRLGAT